MNPTTIEAILGAAISAVEFIERYGPEAYETVKAAVAATASKGGPSLDDIVALHEKTLADNAAIQNA